MAQELSQSGKPSESLSQRELIERLCHMGAGALAAALGAGVAGTLGAGCQSGSAPSNAGTGRKFRYGMVIDTRRQSRQRHADQSDKHPPGDDLFHMVPCPLDAAHDDYPL